MSGSISRLCGTVLTQFAAAAPRSCRSPSVPDAAIRETTVLYTIIDGKIVYRGN
jgi:hypothetical protein